MGNWASFNKHRELSVISLNEADDEDSEFGGSEPPLSPTEEIPTKVSLNSVIGLSSPKTMKLLGKIGNREVIVMIDPGATHNFISLVTVEKLGIVVEESSSFGVSLGNGDAIRGKGVCRQVGLKLAGGTVMVKNFLPLQLGNSDLILGVQWLEKLGTVVINSKTQVMEFRVDGKTLTLIGDPTLARSRVSLQAMIRTLQKEGGGLWLEINQVDVTEGKYEKETTHVPVVLELLLKEFATVFTAPTGLPPARGHEHAIVLKKGSNPVSVRPYRYPQFQKDEIEKLIKEMLAAKIIMPSSSPFSSPVLLVKKKKTARGVFVWNTRHSTRRRFRTSIQYQ